MTEQQRFILRCTYRETGRLALLSHLEAARALERAVRRARLPFAVSQGFSPHMKLSFGAALPVGVGSTCEIFDVQLVRYVPAERALGALAAASVDDLMVVDARYLSPRAPAASVAFPLSTYELVLSRPVEMLPVPSEVTVVRKRRERVLRVEEFLHGTMQRLDGSACGVSGSAREGNRVADRGAFPSAIQATSQQAVFRFTLEAKPTGSLRPDVLVRECLKRVRERAEDAGAGEPANARAAAPGQGVACASETGCIAACDPLQPLEVVSLTRVEQRSLGGGE